MIFFLVFNSNWAGVFVKLKLKPPFKNPGSATADARDRKADKAFAYQSGFWFTEMQRTGVAMAKFEFHVHKAEVEMSKVLIIIN